jgi:hypothetical protein
MFPQTRGWKMNLQALKARLNLEAAILAEEMPQFRLSVDNGSYCFKGWQIATTANRKYELKLVIPPYYPDQMPSLYVNNPLILPKYKNQGTINSAPGSHAFHTNSKGPGGCVEICHSKSTSWDASKTCVGVFTKGILWLIAYECHLTNGKSINDNLIQFKRRQQ